MTTQKEMFAADPSAGLRVQLREALDAAEAAARDVLLGEAACAEADSTARARRIELTQAHDALARARQALALAAAALAGPGGEGEQCPDPPAPATPAPEPPRASAGATTTNEAVVPPDEVVTPALPAEVAEAVGAEPAGADRDWLKRLELLLSDPPIMESYPRTAAALAPLRGDWPEDPTELARLVEDADAAAVCVEGELLDGLCVYEYLRPGMIRLMRDRFLLPLARQMRADLLALARAEQTPPADAPPSDRAARIDFALREALHQTADARQRWAAADVMGAPDDVLLEAIAHQFHWCGSGGKRHPGEGGLYWFAGDGSGGPYLFVDQDVRIGATPALEGAGLVAAARRVLSGGKPRAKRSRKKKAEPAPLPPAPLEAEGPIEPDGVACWLPGPLSCPPHLDAARWEAVLTQLRTLPRWWGRGDHAHIDLTARVEQELVRSLLRGTPLDDRDRAKIDAIGRHRGQRKEAAPVWQEWAEFDVSLPGGAQVRCVYLADFGGFDSRHFMFKGPAEVLSDTGVWVTWAVRDNAPREGEGVEQYAARVCAACAHEYARKNRGKGKKHAPSSALEGKA